MISSASSRRWRAASSSGRWASSAGARRRSSASSSEFCSSCRGPPSRSSACCASRLPAEEIAILYLQVNFAGSVDFEKGQIQFDASLYNSRVLIFPLTGDMAVRIYWKDNPNFLLTVGGFHPAYTPPPMNLGNLARVGIVLFQGNPNVRAEGYFAITSNTLQFGARVELYAGADIFNVYGFVGLDVLINFNPFHFIAELAAMLAVRTGSHVLFSVKLEGVLEGPTPWHARGSASFEIGFIITITIRVKFDVTVGDARDTTLPPIDVLPELVKALSNLGNWRAAPAECVESAREPARAARSGNPPGAAPVRRARGRPESGAARHRDPAVRFARAGRRQHLPHR